MNEAVLLLGSNAGDREKMLADAVALLKEHVSDLTGQSHIYETAAWGFDDQPAFLNQVLIINTRLTASALLQLLLTIEQHMGRVRNQKWEQRCIDIDILFYANEVIEEDGLKIPHPHLHERRFTLVPLNELIPGYIHPVFSKTIKQLLLECKDDKEVQLFA